MNSNLIAVRDLRAHAWNRIYVVHVYTNHDYLVGTESEVQDLVWTYPPLYVPIAKNVCIWVMNQKHRVQPCVTLLSVLREELVMQGL